MRYEFRRHPEKQWVLVGALFITCGCLYLLASASNSQRRGKKKLDFPEYLKDY